MRSFLPHQIRRLFFCLWLALVPPLSAQIFPQPVVIPTGNWPAAIYSADINNDGFPDLIYIDQDATPTSATTHVLLNDGRGNFKQSAQLATAGNSIAIVQFTGSGHLDLAWLTGTTQSNMQSHFAFGNGDGTFAATVSSPPFLSPGLSPNPIQWGFLGTANYTDSLNRKHFIAEDVANNNLWEFGVYVGNFGGFPSAYFATGPQAIPDGSGPLTMADLNGDGKNDIIISGQTGLAADIFLQQCGFGFCPAIRNTGASSSRMVGRARFRLSRSRCRPTC